MKRFEIVYIFVALLFTTAVSSELTAQPAPSIPSLSGDQIEQLNSGETLVSVVVAEDGTMTSDVIGVIQAPGDQLLAIIDDFDSYTEFMPTTAEAEIVGREGEFRLCRGVTDTPWPVEDREYVLRVQSGPQTVDGMEVLVNTWDYVPDSGNVEDIEGYWVVMPWNEEGTVSLVRYFVVSNMGIPLPDFLVTWASEDMLPGYIEALRGRIQ